MMDEPKDPHWPDPGYITAWHCTSCPCSTIAIPIEPKPPKCPRCGGSTVSSADILTEGHKMTKPTYDDLRKRFFFHKPRDTQAIINHEKVSELTLKLATELVEFCPEGRNLSLALTALEEVRMRANAAIACDDTRP